MKYLFVLILTICFAFNVAAQTEVHGDPVLSKAVTADFAKNVEILNESTQYEELVAALKYLDKSGSKAAIAPIAVFTQKTFNNFSFMKKFNEKEIESLRVLSIRALGNLRDPISAAFLDDILKKQTEFSKVRTELIKSLAKLKCVVSRYALEREFKKARGDKKKFKTNFEFRKDFQNIIFAMGELGAGVFTDILADFLEELFDDVQNNKNYIFAEQVLKALGKIANPSVLNLMMEFALEIDVAEYIRRKAMDALETHELLDSLNLQQRDSLIITFRRIMNEEDMPIDDGDDILNKFVKRDARIHLENVLLYYTSVGYLPSIIWAKGLFYNLKNTSLDLRFKILKRIQEIQINKQNEEAVRKLLNFFKRIKTKIEYFESYPELVEEINITIASLEQKLS